MISNQRAVQYGTGRTCSAATDLKFLPDGSLLVLGKEGQVVRYADPSNGDMTPTTILTIPPNSIETGAERGLLAVEVDPDFLRTGSSISSIQR